MPGAPAAPAAAEELPRAGTRRSFPPVQMSYSLTRFAIYDTAKNYLGQGRQGPPPFYQKVLVAAAGGEAGGGPLALAPSGWIKP